MQFITPKNNIKTTNFIELETSIKLVKDTFERKLANLLQLTRVSAPLFVETHKWVK